MENDFCACLKINEGQFLSEVSFQDFLPHKGSSALAGCLHSVCQNRAKRLNFAQCKRVQEQWGVVYVSGAPVTVTVGRKQAVLSQRLVVSCFVTQRWLVAETSNPKSQGLTIKAYILLMQSPLWMLSGGVLVF